MIRKLNLGCGKDIREGYVNLDAISLPGVDVVWDIEKIPLPFEDEQFEEILCNSILEHVDFIKVLKELHRILKMGGVIKITVPHFSSKNNFIDPTHKRMFSVRTFDFFIGKKRNYYFDFKFSNYHSYISFEKGKLYYNYLIEKIVNSSEMMKNLYESTGFSRIFPAQNIYVELVK